MDPQISSNPKFPTFLITAISLSILFILISAGTAIYFYIYKSGLFSDIVTEMSETSDSPTSMDPSLNQDLGKQLIMLQKENAQLKKQIEDLKKSQSKSTSTSTSTNTTITPPPQPSCTTYKIYEGKFASEKCYLYKDYQDLVYYLGRYNSAVQSYNSAISTIKIVCNGSDFFKESCEEEKDQRDEAEDNMDEYEDKIKSIIAKGK